MISNETTSIVPDVPPVSLLPVVPRALPRSHVVERFREALARLGAPGSHEIFVAYGYLVSCASCFEAGARDLGLRTERFGHEQLVGSPFESYEYHRWVVSSRRDGGPSVEALGIARYGITRLGGDDPDSALWIAHVEYRADGDTDLVLAAGPERARLLRFVEAVHRRHIVHERSRSGLLLIGCGDRRISSEEVAWSEVLLPAAQREEIATTVREFFASAELYRRHGVPHRRGILFVGPPGNGKTTILRAIRTSAKVPVLVAGLEATTRRDLTLRSAFQRAAELAPSVLCFEDLDALVGDGPLLAEFLNLLDGLESLEGVLVVATTNRPERIDPAIARRPSRFDRVFLIAEPDRELRMTYFADKLGPNTPRDVVERVAARTDGFSVAFLKELVVQARFAAIRRGSEHIGEEDLERGYETTSEHLRLATAGLEDRGRAGFGFGDE